MSDKKFFLMSETVKEFLFENGQPKSDCFEFIEHCPACLSKLNKKLFDQWGINYMKCKSCGLVFSNPRLTGKGAYIWYNSEYYNAAMQTEHFLAMNSTKYFSISLSQKHFDKFIEMFKKLNVPKDALIYDIGCGSGAIIQYLKDELGYTNVHGFDLNQANADFASNFRKIDLQMKDIYDLDTNEKCDVIITTENIEHVSDPIEYVSLLSNLLRKGGYLVLTTPHNDEIATKFLGPFGDHFCAPNHQNYFNIKNLSSLLNKYDFNVKSYWLDDSNKFNLYKFIKHFFIDSDQVTTYPPNEVIMKTIWKWNKDRKSRLVMRTLNLSGANYRENRKSKPGMKRQIKEALANIVPIRFKTHQIIAAQKNEK